MALSARPAFLGKELSSVSQVLYLLTKEYNSRKPDSNSKATSVIHILVSTHTYVAQHLQINEIPHLKSTQSLVEIPTCLEQNSCQSPIFPVPGDSASIFRNGSPPGPLILELCMSSKASPTSMVVMAERTP